jgi:hypothetical protein
LKLCRVVQSSQYHVYADDFQFYAADDISFCLEPGADLDQKYTELSQQKTNFNVIYLSVLNVKSGHRNVKHFLVFIALTAYVGKIPTYAVRDFPSNPFFLKNSDIFKGYFSRILAKLGDFPLIKFLFFKNSGKTSDKNTVFFLYGKCKTHVFSHTKIHLNTFKHI